jgi:chemotaxis protein MotA
MRVIVGLLLLVGAFVAAYYLADLGLVGYFNAPALAIIGLSPIAVAIITYERRELLSYMSLTARAFAYDEQESRAAMADALSAVSTALRSGKSAQAVRAVESSEHEAVKTGGLLLLKQYERSALREVFQTWAQTQLANVRRAEDFFLTMARAAPAFGLVGTILGFIDLLRHLKDSESLGPGMAMALTATLYGIASSYCIYHPLAKTLGAYARKLSQELRLCEQAMLLIHDGRSSHDVLMLLRPTAAETVTGQDRVEAA